MPHGIPQPPQLVESLDSSTQTPPHIVPVRHAQLPLLQVGAEGGHFVSQLPQWVVSVSSFTQTPSQTVPVRQVQLPLWQVGAEGWHCMLQPPQLVGSVRSLTHSPRLAHHVKPTAQHTPLWQASPFGHARPQTPQFCESVISFTQPPPHVVSPCGQTPAAAPLAEPTPVLIVEPEPEPVLIVEPEPVLTVEPEPAVDPEPTPAPLEALASIERAPASSAAA